MKTQLKLVSSAAAFALCLFAPSGAKADIDVMPGVSTTSGVASFGDFPSTFETGVTNHSVMVDSIDGQAFFGMSAVTPDGVALANDGKGTFYVDAGISWDFQSAILFQPAGSTLRLYQDTDPAVNNTLLDSNSILIGLPWDYTLAPGAFSTLSTPVDFTSVGTWTFALTSTNYIGIPTDIDAISVVVSAPKTSTVPDSGATALMLGTAFAGLGFMRSKTRSKAHLLA